MKKLLVGLLIFACLLYVLYQQVGTAKPVGPREAIETQIEQISKSKDLNSDQRDLFKLQMAVLDFTSKNSHPPDSLTQLVPTYFDELPINSKTGEPYRYKREGNRPLIGDMVDRAEGKVVAKTEQGSKDPKLAASDENFVNPNDMKLERFVYDATDRRDPFEPFDLSPKKVDGELSPLEQVALGQLRLTAVLSSSSGLDTTAIVETVEGRGFTVKPGMKIGNNNGVIVSIEKDRLKILETTVKFSGEEEQKAVEMILQVGPADAARKKASDAAKAKKKAARNGGIPY